VPLPRRYYCTGAAIIRKFPKLSSPQQCEVRIIAYPSLTTALVVPPSLTLFLPPPFLRRLYTRRLQVSYSPDHLAFVFARPQNASFLIVGRYQFPTNFEDYPPTPQSCLRLPNPIPQGVCDALPTGIRTDTASPLCSVWPLNRMRTSMTN
jgi:hypothetical protein